MPFVGAAKGVLTCLLLVQEKEEFSENIIQDVAALGISYEKLTHTSDYFPEMLDLAERLIKKGYIYADDTPLEQMREVNVVSAFSSLMTCNEHAQGHCACSLQLEGCHQNGMENSDTKPRLLCRYLLLETAASTSDTEKKLQQESQLPINWEAGSPGVAGAGVSGVSAALWSGKLLSSMVLHFHSTPALATSGEPASH